MRDLQAIQADINMMDQAIQGGGSYESLESWQSEKEKYEREYKETLAYLAEQQNLQERVEQAKETGYIFNELETSSGVKLPELSYSPENNELQAIAVQRFALAQEDAFNAKLNALEYELTQERIQNNDLLDHIEQLEQIKYQTDLETAELQAKLKNAADIIAENEIEIKKQANRISELLEQQTGSAVPIAPLSEEEKETKLMAEVMGKQIKVVNVRPKSDSFDNQLFIATNVITGVEFEDHYIYLCKKAEDKPRRYKEISQELADILREEYANKKAEIEAQNAIIPTIEQDIEPINAVSEEEATTKEESFREEEIQTTDNGEVQGDQGNESLHEMVEQESEVITLESLHERLKAVEAKVAA